MKRGKILTMFLFISFALTSIEAWAGPLVWGPKKYVRDTGKPYVVIDSFAIEKPKGKYWLQVSNGEAVQKPGADVGVVEMKNMVSSAIIWLNSEKVVTPDDFNQKVYGFTKDITLRANNSIEVEVRGIPKSFITVEIRKAELNMGVSNARRDLSGLNMQDQIGLWWSYEENASEYIVYKAYSIDGIWIEWLRFDNTPPYNIVDITPETQTRDLCYKMEALDDKGNVIRIYEPICVPKWQKEESSLPLTSNEVLSDAVVSRLFDETHPSPSSSPLMGEEIQVVSSPLAEKEIIKNPSPLWGEEKGEGIFLGQRFGKTCSSGRDSPLLQLAELSLADRFQLTDTPTPLFSNPNLFLEPSSFQLALNTSTQTSTQSSLTPYDKINKMCLTDDEFIDATTMNYEDIKKFLKEKGSFLADVIDDVDDKPIDPALLIFLAAQDNGINPQVLIATLQKEQSAIELKDRLDDARLKFIMGYGKPTTIRNQILDSAAQMRRDFDRLLAGGTTIGGWKVGEKKPTGHFDDKDPRKNNPELDKYGNQMYASPANKAVAVLYNYTPWVGKGWEGIGKNGKQAGGNALFCKVWDQYNFGTPCPSEPAALTLTGNDAPKDGEQYKVEGGTAPYTWSITDGKGSITPDSSDSSKATVSGITNQCGSATITVKDSCRNQTTKDVRMSKGKWVTTSTEYAPYTILGGGGGWCKAKGSNWWLVEARQANSLTCQINKSTTARDRLWDSNGFAYQMLSDPGNYPSCVTVIWNGADGGFCDFSFNFWGFPDAAYILYKTEHQQWMCP